MGNGYTRQSAASIVTDEVINAAPLNAEFNAIKDAFDSTSGHSHDGTTGESQKIPLTTSVTGILPIANGGTNADTAAGARTNLGVVLGSDVQAYDAGLQSISGLTTAADKMIYTTASDVYATTSLSSFARTLIDDADATTARATLGLNNVDNTSDANKPISTATQTALDLKTTNSAAAITGGTITGLTNLVATGGTITGLTNLVATGGSLTGITNLVATGGSITGITDLAVADGGTGASTASAARTNLGATTIGSNLFTATNAAAARSEINVGIVSGFRNKIINGDFDIWQRGTSFSASGYCADRWILGQGAGSNLSVTRVDENLSGHGKYAAAFLRTTSTDDNFAQIIEGVHTLAGKQVTITFYARMQSGVNKTFEVRLEQIFGTGGSPSSSVVTASQTFEVSTSAQKFSFTFNVPSIAGKTLGTNNGDGLVLRILFPASAGSFSSGAAAFFGGISLVEGDATLEADPFSPRSIGEEERLCMRYFEKLTSDLYSTHNSSANFSSVVWNYKVRKRGVPSLSLVLTGATSSAVSGTDAARAINTINSAPGILAGSTADAEL